MYGTTLGGQNATGSIVYFVLYSSQALSGWGAVKRELVLSGVTVNNNWRGRGLLTLIHYDGSSFSVIVEELVTGVFNLNILERHL